MATVDRSGGGGPPGLRVYVWAADPMLRRAIEVGLGEDADAPSFVPVTDAELADVVLVDLGPGAGGDRQGLDILGRAKVPSVALVTNLDEALTARAAGAAGILFRDDPAEMRPPALLAVAHGLVVSAAEAAGPLLVRAEPDRPDSADGFDPMLTQRERQVLGLLAEGLSNREIGARLGVSTHTAKFHISSVLGKLGASRRAEAIVRAAKRGLIDL